MKKSGRGVRRLASRIVRMSPMSQLRTNLSPLMYWIWASEMYAKVKSSVVPKAIFTRLIGKALATRAAPVVLRNARRFRFIALTSFVVL